MSYESACEDLYNQRLAEKQQERDRRDNFRKSIIEKQNSKANNHVYPLAKSTSEVVDICFTMPDVLPDNEDKLKWLIFQNIEMMQKDVNKTKEAKENIKKIKAFIKSQMP